MSDAPPKKVTNPMEAPMKAPGSHAMRWAIADLHNSNPTAAYGAALTVCWSGPGRPKTHWNPRDPTGCGMAVVDELLAREGVGMKDIATAGAKVMVECIVDGLVWDAEVKEELGNS